MQLFDGTKARDIRMKKGMAQKELARLVGVSQSYISDMEHNIKTSPSPKVLARMAEVLGVSMDAFFVGRD